MDLLSSIRKEGSRGGVDFKWEDVTTSQHRENYLGHSLMAPVGRWQKNKDLSWYAKAGADSALKDKDGKVVEETPEEKKARERKEEIKRIKEAEKDAFTRALGLPVVERMGPGSGVNAIDIKEMKKVIKETEEGDDEIEKVGWGRRFGDFVGKTGGVNVERLDGEGLDIETGGLIGTGRKVDRSSRPSRREDENGRQHRRQKSGDRNQRHRHRNRDRSRDRDRYQPRRRLEDDRPRESRRSRSQNRSPDRRERRYRSRSIEQYPRQIDHYEPDSEKRIHPEERRDERRSRSPRTRVRDRRGYNDDVRDEYRRR